MFGLIALLTRDAGLWRGIASEDEREETFLYADLQLFSVGTNRNRR